MEERRFGEWWRLFRHCLVKYLVSTRKRRFAQGMALQVITFYIPEYEERRAIEGYLAKRLCTELEKGEDSELVKAWQEATEEEQEAQDENP